MSISLYDASVMNYIQTLGAVSGFLEKGLSYFKENSIDPESVVETRIFPDMFPFRFQVQSVAHHSIGAIEGIRRGVFSPPANLPTHGYRGLQALIKEALDAVQKVTPEEINGFEGHDINFEYKDTKLPFTVEGFLMTFSLPNLHFHATTAYDILRSKGVPVGKRDYMGRLRLKA